MTKMLADLLRLFRKIGIRCAIKVDDLIAVISSLEEADRVAFVVTRTMIDLGAASRY